MCYFITLLILQSLCMQRLPCTSAKRKQPHRCHYLCDSGDLGLHDLFMHNFQAVGTKILKEIPAFSEQWNILDRPRQLQLSQRHFIPLFYLIYKNFERCAGMLFIPLSIEFDAKSSRQSSDVNLASYVSPIQTFNLISFKYGILKMKEQKQSDWNSILETIEAQEGRKATHRIHKDIPLFLQNDSDLEILRCVQDVKISSLKQMQDWKMNLMTVSERHGLMIVGVDHELYLYNIDPVTQSIINKGNPKRISLDNGGSEINNLKLISCGEREYIPQTHKANQIRNSQYKPSYLLIVTVDMAGLVRMLYLKNLEREPSKQSNLIPSTSDNSTWSVDGAQFNPPRVAVGSNTHKVTVYDLSTGEKSTINAHQHNVPCVSFSPCGRFLATTSIDKTLRIWEERRDPKSGKSKYVCARMTVPSADWGWAVQWIDKTNCEIELQNIQKQKGPPGVEFGTTPGQTSSLQKETDDTLKRLLTSIGSGNQDLRGRDVFEMIMTLQRNRREMFTQLGRGDMDYEDNQEEEGQVNAHGEDSEGEDDEEMSEVPSVIKQESIQDSAIVDDRPIESGNETSVEQLLDKYIMLHCAKLELSLIDVSSGKYLADLSEMQQRAVKTADFMKSFIKQNVQNSMYFEELDLSSVFHMRNYSKYYQNKNIFMLPLLTNLPLIHLYYILIPGTSSSSSCPTSPSSSSRTKVPTTYTSSA